MTFESLQRVSPATDIGIGLSVTDPAPWSPDYVVVCVVTMSGSPDTSDFIFTCDPDKSAVYSLADVQQNFPNKGIVDFALSLQTGQLPGALRKRANYFETGDNAIEFSIKKDCYVFIVLDPEYSDNWQLHENHAAITIGDPLAVPYYGDLKQVMGGTTVAQVYPPPAPAPQIGPGCLVAYFSAHVQPNAAPHYDEFNIHVQLKTADQTLDLRIDPDIKNDGSNPWP